jgi:hypothetical protein
LSQKILGTEEERGNIEKRMAVKMILAEREFYE